MQGEGIGRAIGLQIVPGQRKARQRRETAPQALEAGLTTAFHSVEVHHQRPGALPATGGVFGEFLGAG